MKQLNNWWVLDTENDNGLAHWSPEEWQNHMAEFTVKYFLSASDTKICLDIGGNVGQMAIGLSRYFDKVYTWEPAKPLYNCLVKNLEHFNISNVKAYNIGLSDQETVIPYKMKFDRCGTSRFMTDKEVLVGDHKRPTKSYEFFRLPVRTLDSYGFTKLSLMKLDVEGWEAHVLRGAVKTIETARPIIVAEWKENPISLEEILKPLDYVTVYKRRSDYYFVPKEKLMPIMKYIFDDHPHASHHAFWKLLGI